MSIKRALLIWSFAVAGCADVVEQDEVAMQDADSPDPQQAMLDLSIPFEVLDAENSGLSACVQLHVPVSGPHAGHAPPVSTPPAGSRCAQQDAGLVAIHLPPYTHGMVSLTGVGAHPFHIQVTTRAHAHTMQPVRLLSDAAIAAAYERAERVFEIDPHSVVIETPADGARVALRLQGGGKGPEAVYLDAEGRVTHRHESVAGGWAVFVNLPEGAHEATMAHDELDCSADPLATWGTSPGGAVALLVARDPNLAPIVPNSVAHSGAFRCRLSATPGQR